MSQPKEHRVDEPDTTETETSENEDLEAFSPLDPEMEASINAAVHFDDQSDLSGD